jgi:hypothetical protein
VLVAVAVRAPWEETLPSTSVVMGAQVLPTSLLAPLLPMQAAVVVAGTLRKAQAAQAAVAMVAANPLRPLRRLGTQIQVAVAAAGMQLWAQPAAPAL